MSTFAHDYPIALRLQGQPVLVVGGGPIAEGRIRHLLDADAAVHLVSPRLTEGLAALVQAQKLRWSQREFVPGDTAGSRLVFTAINRREISAQIVAEARAAGILVNAADIPPLCDFHLPSIGRQGPLTVAVSSAGKAPALSRVVRARAMHALGAGYAPLTRLLGWVRRVTPAGPRRTRALAHLAESDAATLFERGDRAGIRSLLRQVLEVRS